MKRCVQKLNYFPFYFSLAYTKLLILIIFDCVLDFCLKYCFPFPKFPVFALKQLKCQHQECVFRSFVSLFGYRQRLNEAGAVFRSR